MRTDNIWQSVYESGKYSFEPKLRIYTGVGDAYNEISTISAPKINRSSNNACLSIGNVNSASLSVSILQDPDNPIPIPTGAKVEVYGRLIGEANTTDWLTFGTYWIDSRKQEHNGLLTISCYDGLQRANQVFDWADYYDWINDPENPKQESMYNTTIYIASRMGIQIDNNSKAIAQGTDYDYGPTTDMKMSDALKQIAICNGGNWVMTEDNTLKLLPLFNADESTQAITVITGIYTQGDSITVSGVTLTDKSGNSFSQGDTSGYVVKAQTPYATDGIVASLYAEFNGVVYNPYAITRSVINPLTQVGDNFTIGNSFTSSIYSLKWNMDTSEMADISAQGDNTLKSEYPYESEFTYQLNTVAKTINDRVTQLTNQVGEDYETLMGIDRALDSLTLNFGTNVENALYRYIRFDENGILLGDLTNENGSVKLRISNGVIYFFDSKQDTTDLSKAWGYWQTNSSGVSVFHVTDIEATDTMTIGDFYWKPEEKGQGLSLVYKGS